LRAIPAASQAPGDTDKLAKLQSQLIGLVADALDHREFQHSAMAIANDFATLFGCQRVSIGTYHGKRLEVDVLSDTSDFEVKSSLARRLAQTMEEACDQGDTVVYPQPQTSTCVTHVHENLAQTNSTSAICTVPLTEGENCVGAILMERSAGPEFSVQEVALAEHASLLLTPILQLKRRAEDPLIKRWRESLASSASKLLGPQNLTAKLSAIVLVCLLSILTTIDGQYQVTSEASLKPDEVRAVVSPTRGFVAQVHGRAGDFVRAGSPLAELDQRDLQLELEKKRNELSKKSKEAQAALATRDRSRMRVLASQEKQIQAEIRLVERLIERGQLVSPVEGVIIAANPSHSFGSPVERGEVLFEIAPLTNFDLIIDVDERDIADISEGDAGHLVLTARPQEPLPFSVKKVVPVSASADGATTFRVEAELHDQPAWIRPGMSGISKIGVDERKLLWIWTHRIIAEIEMRWWRWGWL
jgi:multidrug resistance efflux pump